MEFSPSCATPNVSDSVVIDILHGVPHTADNLLSHCFSLVIYHVLRKDNSDGKDSKNKGKSKIAQKEMTLPTWIKEDAHVDAVQEYVIMSIIVAQKQRKVK